MITRQDLIALETTARDLDEIFISENMTAFDIQEAKQCTGNAVQTIQSLIARISITDVNETQ